jgi:hypothetical protein
VTLVTLKNDFFAGGVCLHGVAGWLAGWLAKKRVYIGLMVKVKNKRHKRHKRHAPLPDLISA